jgi:hypothetical protein
MTDSSSVPPMTMHRGLDIVHSTVVLERLKGLIALDTEKRLKNNEETTNIMKGYSFQNHSIIKVKQQLAANTVHIIII